MQESRNGLQKKMCEQLLFLLVLLAVTFKCQDSSCPTRKDQSSHVEKSVLTSVPHRAAQNLFVWQPLSLQTPASPQGQSQLCQEPSTTTAGYKGCKH